MVNRRLLRCRCNPRVRPCGPLCGQTGAREGNGSDPGYLERFWADFGGLSVRRKVGRGKGWGRKHPTPPTSARSADSFEEKRTGVIRAKNQPARSR